MAQLPCRPNHQEIYHGGGVGEGTAKEIEFPKFFILGGPCLTATREKTFS